MSASFTVPSDYHYVVASLALPAAVAWTQAFFVGRYRKRAKVEYPQMYADQKQVEASRDAYFYNCAQRVHQNTLEAIATLVPSVAITGLEYPRIAAGICVVWTLSRIPYTIGYMSGDPQARGRKGGGVGILSNFVLSFATVFVAARRLYNAKF
ncbi:hypothetical protein AGABI2DRAFT_192272 [Agaricus bisporus var. bisporus H97]|uniref:hypothetical protein n=1 Tax=Agaricus bisporus var. bisporus (strain H97 / ATCC MYA-4626 / FGSC 10389) TaxID=936046 RepID=UPI00029F75F9|nr:hypothetical protein AGABI2DRAFT_192272 [Agaricus bisporus var. bisporus H97]EKV46984.1 hypothetical protein AGABI2DRAFT_192272 [Agaricus bisporus var. bisporus H97]